MSESRPSIALVSARISHDVDEDFAPLRDALRAAGANVQSADWDDPSVDWSAFELAVLRSTWDYSIRLEEFLSWASATAVRTRLINPLRYVRWNVDKHYMKDLAAAGMPVIPSHFIEPGQNARGEAERFISSVAAPEIVVKPAIGAGSRDARRHDRENIAAMAEHVQRLLDSGRSALLQPYLDSVDERGETALIFYDGRFSHAIRKGALLRRGGEAERGLFASENITPRVPTEDELKIAQRVLGAIPFGMPLYARVDLLHDERGTPTVLELELTEPSMFFAHAPEAAARFAEALLRERSTRRA
jgi:glutathione synthase/RimK-type ligase-like ATP-grasp enzyme